MNDVEMAAAEGASDKSRIRQWRKRRALPANTSTKITADEHAARLVLYHRGFGDREIADQRGLSMSAIVGWRQRSNLAPNNPVMRHTAEKRAARMFLYGLGYSDRQIAKEQRVRAYTVFLWRRRHDLPPNRCTPYNGQKRGKAKDSTAQVMQRIERAIGRGLPPDIRSDAIADLYLAVVDGSVSIDAIEREAQKFGNRVLGQFASKYGPRSLDEEIGSDGDGFTLLDTLVDDSSSAWLEEMGATVW